MKTKNTLWALVMMLVALNPLRLAAQEGPAAYTLGPGDQLQLRVVVWNDDLRGFEVLPFFQGDYAIQTDGLALIPLAGAIQATGKTRYELAEDISEALKRSAGLIDSPSVSVEIVSYRPFYVIGDVASPGEYQTRPGITVAQAHALSGGRTALRDGQSAALAAFRDAGSLRQTLGEMARVRIRIARLEAERDGLAEITFPTGNTHPDGQAAINGIEASEQAIFDSRRVALDLEASSIEALKELLVNEVTLLEQKLDGQKDQTALARENLANLESLVERGISRAAPLLDAQRGLFDQESKELDLEDGIFRARQRINEADRDLIALRSRRNSDINRELQQAKSEAENLAIREATLRRLIEENELAAVALDDTAVAIQYSITRSVDGQSTTFAVAPGDLITPGDVLNVERVTLAQ